MTPFNSRHSTRKWESLNDFIAPREKKKFFAKHVSKKTRERKKEENLLGDPDSLSIEGNIAVTVSNDSPRERKK